MTTSGEMGGILAWIHGDSIRENIIVSIAVVLVLAVIKQTRTWIIKICSRLFVFICHVWKHDKKFNEIGNKLKNLKSDIDKHETSVVRSINIMNKRMWRQIKAIEGRIVAVESTMSENSDQIGELKNKIADVEARIDISSTIPINMRGNAGDIYNYGSLYHIINN